MATTVLSLHRDHPNAEHILRAARVIKEGGLVVFPTETVYGIAADAENHQAVERMRKIKQRPAEKPFASLIDHPDKVFALTEVKEPRIFKIINRFWPGPLTIIVPKAKDKVTSIGLRMPNHNVALRLLQESGCSLAAPSANLSGKPAPVTCAEALADLDGLVDLALDSGPVDIGQSSTILDFTQDQPKVLREGVIAQQELDDVMKRKHILFVCTGNSCRSVMAEYMLRHLLDQSNDILVQSAGTAAFMSTSASPETIQVLKEQNIDASGHRSQPVTQSLLREADIIFVMTQQHRAQVLQYAPDVADRVYLLREFGQTQKGDAINNLDIPDPIGQSHEVYQASLKVIKKAVEKIKELI